MVGFSLPQVYLYIGCGFSSKEHGMLPHHVSTVAQNGQTAIETTHSKEMCSGLRVLGRRGACYGHGAGPFVIAL